MSGNSSNGGIMVDIKYHCSMKYSLDVNEYWPRLKEHPECKGQGIIKNVDKEYFLKSSTFMLNEKMLQVKCPKCGTLLNWFSGNFEIVQ